MFNTLYYCMYIFQYLDPSIIYMSMYIRIKQCLGICVCVCLSVSKKKHVSSKLAKLRCFKLHIQSLLRIVLGISQGSSFCRYFELLPPL